MTGHGRGPATAQQVPHIANIYLSQMTNGCGVGRLCWVVLGALVLACASALALMGHLSSAGITYVDGDWSIDEDTTLSNGTWWVSGNVTVGAGTLRLEGAALVLASDGVRELRVNYSARVLGRDSVLRGAGGELHVELMGAGEFHDCTLSALGDGYYDAGIRSIGGNLVLDGCTLMGEESLLSSSTSLQVRACRFEGFHDNGLSWRSSGTNPQDPCVTVEASTFNGLDHGTAIKMAGPGEKDPDWSVRVAGCTISNVTYSVDVQGFGGHGHLTLENNTARDCLGGLQMRGAGRAVVLRGNHWVGSTYDAGMHIVLADSGVPAISDETIKGGSLDIVGGSEPITLRNISVEHWGTAVVCSAAHVDIIGSTINPTGDGFSSEGGALIHLSGCVHSHRAVVEKGTSGEVRETVPLIVRSVSWQEGTPICGGSIAFVDPAGMVAGGLGFPVPAQTVLTSWLVTENGTYRPEVARVHYENGLPVVFLGSNITIGFEGPVDIVVYDECAPDISTESPCPDTVLGSSTIVVAGEVWEFGAGMGTVSVRIDGGDWTPVALDQGRAWTTTLVDVPDGVHNITVLAVDRAGNSGTRTVWNVTMDATRPPIEIMEPRPWVNCVAVWLQGRTEVGASVTINGTPVHVGAEGGFRLWVGLLDGPNGFEVHAVDRAGNSNATTYTVVLDTAPPRIVVLGPPEGSWTCSGTVTVRGTTDEPADVTVCGVRASVRATSFVAAVTAAEGPLVIEVTAVDQATNSASTSILVHIDLTAPAIDIASPGDDHITSVPRVQVIGSAHDVGDIALTVRGEPVDIESGAWRTTLDLTDGWNVITVLAVDVAGNRADRTLRVLLDRTAPTIWASIPLGPDVLLDRAGGLVTGRRAANVSVGVDERGTLRVADMDAVEILAGDQTFEVGLGPGTNLIVVNFTDAAGNCAREVRLWIVKDVVPPPIKLTSPRNGTTTEGTWVELVGATEAGATLTVGGKAVEVGADGGFQARVDLAPGPNTITITAADGFGNEANATVRVVRLEAATGPSSGGGPKGATVAVALLIAGLVVLVVLLSRSRSRGRPAAPRGGGGAPPGDAAAVPSGAGVRVRRGR